MIDSFSFLVKVCFLQFFDDISYIIVIALSLNFKKIFILDCGKERNTLISRLILNRSKSRLFNS